ncbi:MAG: RT0821/Lpp0805 family surface protein [Amphritea sp.]
MMHIDTQTLMAYADGELDRPEQQRVEQALERSPELQQQLVRMCQLDTLLGAAYSDALHSQQPPLRALEPVTQKTSFRSSLGQWLGQTFSWQPGVAAALLVLGVVVGGLYERQSQQTEFAMSQQQLQQAIDKALETHLSREPLQWSSDNNDSAGTITPVRTYKSEQGQYCREFIERHDVGGQITEQRGVACRGEQGWQLKANYYM